MFGLAFGILALATAAVGRFPYGASLVERGRAASLATTSPAAVVAVPGEAMPHTDSVAVVDAQKVDFVAFDEVNWRAMQADFVKDAQAALVMRQVDGVPVWMGFTNGTWTELSGIAAQEDLWYVRIDTDYSLGAGQRRVRYSVSRDGAEFVSLTPEGSEDAWLPIGTEGDAFFQVLVCGFGEMGEIVARSGERPLSGRVATVEDVLLDYSGLTVGVSIEDAWGADGARITLKDETGAPVAMRSAFFEQGRLTADFSDVAQPGASYRYDITLTGSYNGKDLANDIASRDVNLFALFSDFAFKDGVFQRATTEGIDVVDGTFSSLTVDAAGTVTPLERIAANSLMTTVSATLDVSGAFAEAELASIVPLFGLTLARLGDGSTSWVCAESGGWTPVSALGVPTVAGTYDVKVDLDFAAGTVAYFIKSCGDYRQLMAGTRAEFPLQKGKTRLEKLSVRGGAVRSFEVHSRTTDPVEPEVKDDVIVLTANSNVRLKRLKPGSYAVELAQAARQYHLSWTDEDGKYAVLENGRLVVKVGTPANGFSSAESYVLGLDAEEESAKPVLTFRPSADGSSFELDLPTLSLRDERETGVRVGYELISSSDIMFKENCQSSGVSRSSRFTVRKTDDPQCFYRIRIHLGSK